MLSTVEDVPSHVYDELAGREEELIEVVNLN